MEFMGFGLWVDGVMGLGLGELWSLLVSGDGLMGDGFWFSFLDAEQSNTRQLEALSLNLAMRNAFLFVCF